MDSCRVEKPRSPAQGRTRGGRTPGPSFHGRAAGVSARTGDGPFIGARADHACGCLPVSFPAGDSRSVPQPGGRTVRSLLREGQARPRGGATELTGLILRRIPELCHYVIASPESGAVCNGGRLADCGSETGDTLTSSRRWSSRDGAGRKIPPDVPCRGPAHAASLPEGRPMRRACRRGGRLFRQRTTPRFVEQGIRGGRP